MKTLLQNYVKLLKYSIYSIASVSFIAILYSSFRSVPTIKSIFDFNYIIAVVIILYGLGVYFMPVKVFKKNRLVDHSNYVDVVREEKESKISGALESIFWGLSNMIIVGVLEIIVRNYLVK